jgi:hypothetical protein
VRLGEHSDDAQRLKSLSRRAVEAEADATGLWLQALTQSELNKAARLTSKAQEAFAAAAFMREQAVLLAGRPWPL